MPIYAISAIPAPVTYVTRSNATAGFIGTNYSTRSQDWWDPNLRNPYTMNWDLSTQYQLSRTYVIELLYQGSAGVGLSETWNINAFPVDFGANNPALRAAAFAAPQNYLPYPQLFGAINFRSNLGHSTYHRRHHQSRAALRPSPHLSIPSLPYSKAIDSSTLTTPAAVWAPIQNRALEKARAGFDRPKRFFNSITYEFPVGKGRRFLSRGGWPDYIIGGWQTAWDIGWESGAPLTFSFANSPYNYFPTSIAAQRPNCPGNPALLSNWYDMGPARFNQLTVNPIIDINQFSYPAAFTPGTCGRNIVGGPPIFTAEASGQKVLKFKERFNLTLRVDIHSAQ